MIKIKNKIAVVMIALLALTGMAAAQSGDYGTATVSEQVPSYNTGSDATQAFNVSGLSSATIDVELLNDGDVVATVEDVQLDTDGYGYADANNMNVDVDQMALYHDDANNTESVTHYTDYDGTADGEGDTANYQTSQEYTDFSESGGLTWALLFGIVILMAVLGAVEEFM